MAIIRRTPQNNISTWTPMRSLMDEFMRFPDWEDFAQGFNRSLSSNMWEDESAVYIKAALPGVNPDDVEITFNNNTLIIKGEMKEEEENNDKKYYEKYIKTGSFMQSWEIPANVDSDKSEANFDKGMLTIKLPKTEAAKPKQIKINK